ncbi:MAG: 2'-5' RNA ligase family protein, partial [bacterium]|nr:2'-5' RNA ligase family protein [bacterium]
MLHRIFLAINLPETVKQELLLYQEKWPELTAKRTKPENLHITLNFIGNVSDKELESLKKETREDVGKQKPFVIKLSRIVYGPPDSQP